MNKTILLCAAAVFLTASCSEEALLGHVDAYSTRVNVTRAATVDECPNGGVVIEYGIDSNGNSVLDRNEVHGTDVVCHGQNGIDGQIGTNGHDGAN